MEYKEKPHRNVAAVGVVTYEIVVFNQHCLGFVCSHGCFKKRIGVGFNCINTSVLLLIQDAGNLFLYITFLTIKFGQTVYIY